MTGTPSRSARYREVADILVRQGFGYLLGGAGRGLLPVARPAGVRLSGPVRLRRLLEELGPTFIKFGQILSTRADLLPPPYSAELARLQDSAPPVPAAAVIAVIEAELGQPIASLFATFDPVPLAAASIGQVHAATLPDGTAVVIKVRRPGVVAQIEEDLAILEDVATTAARHWPPAAAYDSMGLAQEFAQTLRAELDYIHEGRNAERFAHNFAGNPDIHIPRVYWATTTACVLTLERIQGIKINDMAALDAARIARPLLARRAARLVLQMVFEDGFFHADPHPGNFFVEPDGRIGLMDFGMVGTIDARTQDRLVSLFLAVLNQDADRLVDSCLELGLARQRVNRALLRQDLEHLIARYYGLPLGAIAIRPLLADSLAVMRRHQLRLPAHLALLLKTLVMHEGLGVQLDPGFSLPAAMAPYARRLLTRQYAPGRWTHRLGQASIDLAWLGVELPQHVRRIAGEIERGGLEVGMRPEGFAPLLAQIERLVNRIVLGILAAALINGLALLLTVYHLPEWERWAGGFFAVGFLGALLLGIYLAWSILRGHYRDPDTRP